MKWTRIVCCYYKNYLTKNLPVLEVIDPKNGTVFYLSLPRHKECMRPNSKSKKVVVYFDANWNIKRIKKESASGSLSGKQLSKVFDRIDNLFK
jgi:hypothetical protein